MLTNNMSLRQMIDYTPSQEELAALPLAIKTFIKGTIISKQKASNYAFLRYFYSQESLMALFYESEKTLFYDFDATEVKNSHKFLTIFTLQGKKTTLPLAKALQEILIAYPHEADILFDFYALDKQHYRLSRLEGVCHAEKIL